MRGTVAKRIRKEVYGEEFSPRLRRLVRAANGQILNFEVGKDRKLTPGKRMIYQYEKMKHVQTPRG